MTEGNSMPVQSSSGERNRAILAEYPREKLLDLIGRDFEVDGKSPEHLSDEALRDLALAVTQGL